MKIVYCLHETFLPRGMERILIQKANYWASHYNYEVFIVTTDQQNKSPFYPIDKRVKSIDLNINYNELGGNLIYRFINKIQKRKKHKYRLQQLLQDIRPDITISMYGPEKAFLPKIKDGSKKILEVHTSYYYIQKSYYKYFFMSYLIRQREMSKIKEFDKFIVLTARDQATWPLRKNVIHIGNSININDKIPSKLDQPQVLAVGALSEEKGFIYLIKAWEIVSRRHPSWELTILGEGDQRSELEKMIDKLHLQTKIKLPGKEKNIENAYANSSILVMSSQYEGFGLVLTEAMSHGLPCVSFDCPCGPSDIINSGVNGFLVTLNDTQALADKICYLIENESIRKKMGNKARNSITKFSEEVIMQQWNSLFITLLNE